MTATNQTSDETIMQTETENSLRKIGCQLDSFLFPLVRNGGIVVPSNSAVSPQILGKEYENAKSRKRRAEIQSTPRRTAWQGPLVGARSSDRSGSSGNAASLVSTGLRTKYEAELSTVETAYPGMQHWQSDDGIWLLVESSLLPGLSPKAHFAVGISFTHGIVRAWGFQGSAAVGFEWIGPRHTNFPDGSICAFEPTDGTWAIGDPLINLLDLYTLWAVRHLHFKVVGRWPGYQAVPYPYERILELREDEYCGCANSHKLYGQCCMESDLARNRIAEAIKFTLRMGGGLRKPPRAVVNFLLERVEPPPHSILTG